MKVLVIEDSPFYQKLYANFFYSRGVEPTIVGQGLHGLDVYDCDTFDMIFVDINLPDVSGWEVIKCIENDNSEVQVVPVTGYEAEWEDALFKTVGTGKFLLKPFEGQDIEEFMTEESYEYKLTGGIMEAHLSNSQEEKMKNNLLNFCEGMGMEISVPLLEIFVNELKSKVPPLKALNDQSHFSEIESYVHQLKSNCRYFGFTEFAEVCNEIERLIVQGMTGQINHLIDQLTDQGDTLLAVVVEVLNESKLD